MPTLCVGMFLQTLGAGKCNTDFKIKILDCVSARRCYLLTLTCQNLYLEVCRTKNFLGSEIAYRSTVTQSVKEEVTTQSVVTRTKKMKKISIIGMGMSFKDLTQKHIDIINNADIILGGKRHLAYFRHLDIKKKIIESNIKEILEFIKLNFQNKNIVVLASGDPLFYGIGNYLSKNISKEHIDIYPNISALSYAFSKIKESWHDAFVISLHGRDHLDNFFASLINHKKIAVYTDNKQNPSWLAKQMIEKKITDFQMCVLEDLGMNSEKISWHSIDEAADLEFSQLNIVILKKINENNHIKPYTKPYTKPYIGMPDDLFIHEKGLITKAEVRAVSISKLDLKSHHILWDLGAGSGSVSIESSVFIQKGKIYAVEKNKNRVEQIRQNKEKFQAHNIEIIHGELPDSMNKLPKPHRIFIGGGGKNLNLILEQACENLLNNGIIVINAVLISNISNSLNILKSKNFTTDLFEINISRLKSMPWDGRMEALNPVWIITGKRVK